MTEFDPHQYIEDTRKVGRSRSGTSLGLPGKKRPEFENIALEGQALLLDTIHPKSFLQTLLGLELAREGESAIERQFLDWFGHHVFVFSLISRFGEREGILDESMAALPKDSRRGVCQELLDQYLAMCDMLALPPQKNGHKVFQAAIIAYHPPGIIEEIRQAYPDSPSSVVRLALTSNPRDPLSTPALRRGSSK